MEPLLSNSQQNGTSSTKLTTTMCLLFFSLQLPVNWCLPSSMKKWEKVKNNKYSPPYSLSWPLVSSTLLIKTFLASPKIFFFYCLNDSCWISDAKLTSKNPYDEALSLTKFNLRQHPRESYPLVITMTSQSREFTALVRYGFENLIVPVSKITNASVSFIHIMSELGQTTWHTSVYVNPHPTCIITIK